MPARQIIESHDLADWFGKSVVKAADGSPLEVWHGSTAKFKQFDFDKARDGAHFFTPDPLHAAFFGRARSFYLKIENPLVIDQEALESKWDELVNDGGESGVLPRDMVAHFVKDARQRGHDGLIVRGMADLDLQSDVYLPFSPEQIRSAESPVNARLAMRAETLLRTPPSNQQTVIQEGSIVYGWAQDDHVITAPFTDGEDSHHITQRHLLPGGDDRNWKRWRFNSNLDAVFWWEAPTKKEREAVKHDLASKGFYAHEDVFVELNSTRVGNWEKAKGMRRARQRHMVDSPNRIEAGAGEDLLDVTHYPDARTDYVSRWLARDGD